MKKFQLKIGIILLIIVISLSSLGIIFFKKLKVSMIPLSEQRWSRPPGLVTAFYKNQTPGLSVFRLVDGKEEKLDGSWTIHYFQENEMSIYGSFNAESTTSTESQARRLFLLTDRGGEVKDISKLSGEIISLEQNPSGTYFLIYGLKENPKTKVIEPYACVAEKLRTTMSPCDEVLGKILTKDLLDNTVQHRIFWNKLVERQLVIAEVGGKNRVFLYDPWEDKPTVLTDEAEKTKILKQFEETEPSVIPNYTVKQIGGLTLFQDAQKVPVALAKIPQNSATMWVTPEIYLYTKGTDMYIVNVTRKTESKFTFIPSGTYLINTYHNSKNL